MDLKKNSFLQKLSLLGSFARLLLVFSFLVITGPAFAQDENDSQIPARETAEERKTQRAAAQAMDQKALDFEEEVSFEQIMADPDNIELNFRFAKSMVARGDILTAASTLERILAVNPDLARVRLFYAVVLYRLDNLNEAEVQFRSVREYAPPPMRYEIDDYLKKIKRNRKRTHISLRQSLGFQFDTNRNAAPSSKKRLFGNALSDVSRQDGIQDDTSFLNITSFNIRHDLGFQAGHEIFASFDYFLAEQTEVDTLDLSSYRTEVGTVLKSDFFNLTPSFFFENILLSRETFTRSQGGNLKIDRDLFKRINVYASGRLQRQDFSDITENLAAHERSGNILSSALGFHYPFWRNRMTLSPFISFLGKDAKEEYNAYNQKTLGLTHSWILGKGQFLINSLDLERDDYEAPDQALAAIKRYDKNLRYRVTYGAPLTFFVIGKFLPRPFRDMTITFSYEYFRSLSNLTNYTYRNNKFQGMVTKTWEF